MTDLVLCRSSNVVKYFSWYCANNVLSLSLVISGIYDVRKRMSEYYEYFERFNVLIKCHGTFCPGFICFQFPKGYYFV